jgi:hypothetical protein
MLPVTSPTALRLGGMLNVEYLETWVDIFSPFTYVLLLIFNRPMPNPGTPPGGETFTGTILASMAD